MTFAQASAKRGVQWRGQILGFAVQIVASSEEPRIVAGNVEIQCAMLVTEETDVAGDSVLPRRGCRLPRPRRRNARRPGSRRRWGEPLGDGCQEVAGGEVCHVALRAVLTARHRRDEGERGVPGRL
jgi:hypothetical protein